MDFHDRLAIFQLIFLGNHRAGQFALFADWHETKGELMRDGPAKDEAACLKAHDLVNLLPGIGVQHLIHRHAKAARIGKQRGDITKQDALMREIHDRADVVFDRFCGCHGPSPGWV